MLTCSKSLRSSGRSAGAWSACMLSLTFLYLCAFGHWHPGMYEGKGHCYIAALSCESGQVSPLSPFLAKVAFTPHARGARVDVTEEDQPHGQSAT